MRQAPPQSSFDSTTALTFRCEQGLPGFLPSSRHHCSASTRTGVPESPLGSVLRRSQPLDGLLRSAPREPISSHNRVQDARPFRGLATLHRLRPHRPKMPPCRWTQARSPTNRWPQTKLLDFEALLHTKPRSTGSVVKPHQRTLPSSGFVLLQVVS
jgi:hypothetical protein